MNAYFIIFENTILRTSLRIMMAMAIMLSVANVDGMAQIKPPLTLPLITSQPSDVEATEGDEVSFSVETITLVKPEIMSFEWHQVGFISRTPLSTSSTLRIKNVSIRDAGKYYCIVKINPARNGYLSEETSHEATLKVNPGIKGDPPELSGSPLPDGIVGVKYYVELNAKGTSPISWSIYKGELPGGLSLNASTGVISGEPKSAGNFSFVVRVTNAFGENTREYGIRIESPVAPPSIINHPSDQSVVENETAVFSVNATGSDLSYQWQAYTSSNRRWTDLRDIAGNIKGANDEKLSIVALASMDNAQFRCIVSNSAGSATSKEATLTVKGGAAPPVIAKQPSPATATPGGSVTFSVSVESDEKLTYQWQVLAPRSLLGWQNVVNSGLMTPKGSIYYAGATTDQLSISDIPATQNGAQYRCMITGPGGSITSNPVTLTVQAAAVDPPVITTQPPAKVALKEGGTTKLSVTANGNGQPLQYQWEIRNPSWGDGFYDVGDEDGRYSGINTAMLTISNTPSYFDGYQYRCRVTAGNLIDVPVYSNTVTLAVEEYIFEFTLQPSDRTVKEGGNTTFSVAVTVGQVPLQYQWYYITYYYYDYGYGYGGDYYPTYSLIENDGIFSDAQTATLKLTGAPARMDGYEFVCGVSVPNYWEGGMLSEYMSDQAMLSVEAIGPGIISHPADRRIPEGGNTTFSVTTVSSLPSTTCEVELLYEYQWQYRLPKSADDDFNDVEDGEIYSGTSTSTLTLNNVPISYSGYQYRCKVFTISCSEFYDESNSATLTVDAPSNNVPSILTHPDDQSIRQGANASFSVTTAHAGKFSYLYQWQYRVNANSNFINVPNSGIYSDAQMATLKLTDVPLAYHNYQYRCRVYLPEWNEWTEFSNHATLEVTPADAPPKITTTSVPAAEVKKPYNITLRATGTTPITWSITAGRLPNGLSLNSGSGVISGTPTVAGPLQFTVRAANRIGNDTRAFTIAVNETPQQPPVIEITSPSAPFCTANDYLRVPFKKIENEHPMKYSLRYNDEAKAVGFKDTSFENLPADMVFKIDVPAGVPSKSYSATVVITCERLDEYMNEYPFTFSVTNNGVVIVNQPPAFQSICGGASIALTVDIAGNASNYQWYINGQAIAGAVNKDYIADKEGIYYVEVRGSCGVVRSAEAVVASPASAPGSVSIQTKWGNVLYVENSADKYNRFQWYRDGSAISGATFVYFSEKEGFLGEYYVRCFKPDGAFDDTCPIVFTTRSIVSTASVYPTRLKANDVLNVEIKEANTAINARVEIYSVLGLKVYSTRINMPVTTIRPTGMNRGNYFVKIRLSSGEIINEKIVVQ